MEKKGQRYLLLGVALSIVVSVSTFDFVPEWELLGFFRGVGVGMGLVFVINGLVLIIRSKNKNK